MRKCENFVLNWSYRINRKKFILQKLAKCFKIYTNYCKKETKFKEFIYFVYLNNFYSRFTVSVSFSCINKKEIFYEILPPSFQRCWWFSLSKFIKSYIKKKKKKEIRKEKKRKNCNLNLFFCFSTEIYKLQKSCQCKYLFKLSGSKVNFYNCSPA